MSIEKEIICYLKAYGNTREKDLMNHGVQNLGLAADKMKKIIDRMTVKGKLHRIVHNRLKPPEVYITLEEPLPPILAVEEEVASQEVTRILQEAASIANKIGREKPS